MFSKLAIFFAAFMAIFVAALPSPGPGITNSCNGGQVYCCDSVQSADSKAAQDKFNFLGVAAPTAGSVGLTCTPVNVIGVQKQSCGTQSACCTGNNFNGLVVVGCSPVLVNVR